MEGSTGFYNAPVTMMTMSVTGIASMLSLTGKGTNFPGSSFHLSTVGLGKGELWRMLTCNLAFANTGEFLMGMYLLYKFRNCERQLGSRKFGAFCVFVNLVSPLLQTGFLVAPLVVDHLSAGPYALIFSQFVFYHYHVPMTSRQTFSLFGLTFSWKAAMYMMGLQLLFRSSSSFLAGSSGILAGALYFSDVLPLQKFRLPAFVESAASAFAPLFTSSPPGAAEARQRRLREMMEQRQMQQMQAFQQAGMAGQIPTPEPPREEDIQALTEFGFERDAVLHALRMTGNNRDAAANRLVGGN